MIIVWVFGVIVGYGYLIVVIEWKMFGRVIIFEEVEVLLC